MTDPNANAGVASERPLRVVVTSIRNEHRGLRAPACIHDAAFEWIRAWAERRRSEIVLGQYRVQLLDAPYRDVDALSSADVVILLSSNEFTFHVENSNEINNLAPWVREQRAAVLSRFEEAARGKPIILVSADRADNADNYRRWYPWGERIVAVLDEADVPLTTQTLRVPHLAPLAAGIAKRVDFAYWGAAKRCAPGSSIVDPRGDVLADLLSTPDLTAITFGLPSKWKVAPGVSRLAWEREQATLFRALAPARSTCCFQWPGGGSVLTARYHEALALGLYPFVWSPTYDTSRSVATVPFQRVSSVEALRERVASLRDEATFRSRMFEVRAVYNRRRWTGERIRDRMGDLLDDAIASARDRIASM